MSIRYTAAFVPSAPVSQGVTFTVADTQITGVSFTIGVTVIVDFSVADTEVTGIPFAISSVLFLPETGFFLF